MEFIERTGPAVNQQERPRIPAGAALMDEMNAKPVNLRLKVIKPVEFAFLRPPVIARPPVLNQLLDI